MISERGETMLYKVLLKIYSKEGALVDKCLYCGSSKREADRLTERAKNDIKKVTFYKEGCYIQLFKQTIESDNRITAETAYLL